VDFSPLKIRYTREEVDGRSQYELLEPLIYCAPLDSKAVLRGVVPAGFVTDLASVPRVLWRLFPSSGRHNEAAVVHDWLYNCGTCSRFLADAIFREGMIALGVPKWKAWLMFMAVRAFGWPNFRKPE
jgi:hypothetical protein